MADYTRATGGSGTMMIRDTGSVVEFWLRAGSETYNYQLDWSFVVNGQNGTREFRFEQGGAWQRLGSFSVSSSQTVQFGIGRSGTEGLGGPTTFAVNISRAGVPSAPNILGTYTISDTAVRLLWGNGTDGGSVYLGADIGIKREGDYPDFIVQNAPQDYTFTGLTPGTNYDVWVAQRNAEGFGPRAYGRVRTGSVPGAPAMLPFNDVTQTSVGVHIRVLDDGGAPITQYQLGYGLQATAPSRLAVQALDSTLGNLQPGRIYFVKARLQNKYGYGPFSETFRVILVGGGFVRVNGVWTPAVPYVNVGGVNGAGGVWKIARPYAKILGDWKISI